MQRDKLEEQFDDLYKDISPEEKAKLFLNSENEEKLNEEFDEEFLIPEYHSDEEKTKGESDSEPETEEEEDFTKVSAF